jgi:hypothetical protein
MDPFVSTLARQAALLGLAAGIVVAVVFFAIQYPKLQHAMSLNMIPGQLS